MCRFTRFPFEAGAHTALKEPVTLERDQFVPECVQYRSPVRQTRSATALLTQPGTVNPVQPDAPCPRKWIGTGLRRGPHQPRGRRQCNGYHTRIRKRRYQLLERHAVVRRNSRHGSGSDAAARTAGTAGIVGRHLNRLATALAVRLAGCFRAGGIRRTGCAATGFSLLSGHYLSLAAAGKCLSLQQRRTQHRHNGQYAEQAPNLTGKWHHFLHDILAEFRRITLVGEPGLID